MLRDSLFQQLIPASNDLSEVSLNLQSCTSIYCIQAHYDWNIHAPFPIQGLF